MHCTFALPAPAAAGAAVRCRTVRVRSADDLRRALREAQHAPLALDGSGLDRVLRLDGTRALLEVQAATRWQALGGYAAAQRAALERFARAHRLPASVGGAVSENAAGPDGRPLSAHVEAITLVTPDGELRRASRGVQPELFRLVLGGHGVFGVLYSVTLRLDSLLDAAAKALEPVALAVPGAPASAEHAGIELLLPPDRLENFLVEVRGIAQEHRMGIADVQVCKLRAETETFLRWATRDWAGVTLRLQSRATLGARVHAAQVRRALLSAAVALGGSFPIAGRPEATRAQLDACYPELGAFLAEKRRFDPGERLQTPWYRHVAGLLHRIPCGSRWTEISR